MCLELNHSSRKRELGALMEPMGFFGLREGFILTSDQEEEVRTERGTVFVRPVWKWMLEEIILMLFDFACLPVQRFICLPGGRQVEGMTGRRSKILQISIFQRINV